jgi:hypothetical protein
MLSMVLFLVALLMVRISCSIICQLNIVLPGGGNQSGLAVIRFRGVASRVNGKQPGKG